MTSPRSATGYPPDEHMLRDLRLWIERQADGPRAGLEVVPETRSDAGSVRAGVLAILVDTAGGECAVRAARPAWVATSDLVLHVTGRAAEGDVVARPSLLRHTHATLVIEAELRAGADPVAFATTTFAVLPAREPVQRMGAGEDTPRTEFALAGSRLEVPLVERIGALRVDASQGAFELPVSAYVGNSLGGLQGGAVGLLVDLAAETAARAHGVEGGVSGDLALNYLALGRVGPVCSRARVLRRDRAGALVRVELRDRGAEDRLLTVATVQVAPTG